MSESLCSGICVGGLYSRLTRQLYKVVDKTVFAKTLKSKFDLLKRNGIQTRYYQTNTILTQRADGKVEASSLVLMISQPADRLTPILQDSGVSKDLIVKTIGGWKFAARSVYLDHK